MTSGNEILFGRIAVYNGLITSDELEECINHQRENAPSRHLGEIILERGLVDEAQARAILTMQRRRLHMGLKPERAVQEDRVVAGLMDGGKLKREDLEVAKRDKSEMEERGLFPSLGDILIQMGAVSLREFSDEQRRTDQKSLFCTSCGKKYRAVGYVPGKDAKCRQCGGRLEAVDATTSASVAPAREEGVKEDTALLSLDDVASVSLPSAVLTPRTPRADAYRPKAGDEFGRCLLEEKIGEGGMGEVYRARHLALDREVAVKVLPPKSTLQVHHVERFFAEARSAAKLDHPNIVTVHDVGEDRGAYYIVMQLIRGEAVKSIISDRGAMDIREALSIARQTADALDYAHTKKIVHRDVKTANILVDSGGHVTIVDFGLTKDIASDARLTSAGIVVGTVQYMSPEQAEGKPVDGRSDLYSLGITLFEMLTGHVPFTGNSPWHILTKHQKEVAPDIRQYRPDIPDRLASLVARLLAKSPAVRPATGAATVEEIDRILALQK
jgi:tRNA A-37 threonylcarbamoyl transferase component Bud32